MRADPVETEPPGPVGLARTLQKLQRHARRARRYGGDIKWLLFDFLGRTRRQAARVVLSGLLHMGTKFLSVALLYVVVHALSDGIPPALEGLPLPPPRSAAFLLLAVCTAFALLLASSCLRYDVRSRGIRLGQEYEEFCARRVFALASRMPDPRAPDASRIVATEPMHLYLSYSRHCGMAARQLTQLLPTLVSFVAGCAVMIWLDSLTTAGLALMALLALLAQYPANHKAAQASRNWERSRSDALRRIVDLFGRLRRAPTPIDIDGPILNGLYSEGSIRASIEGFSGRSQAAEQASLVSRIGSHLVLCGTMLLLGMDIVTGERSWAAVAAYVAAVRFTLTDFVQVSTLANGFTRFHAQLTLYRRFVGDASRAAEPPPGVASAGGLSPLRIPNLTSGQPSWQPMAGTVAVLLTPPGSAPSVSTLLAQSIDDPAQYLAVSRIDRSLLDDRAPLRALLGVSAEADEVEITEALTTFGTALPSSFGPGWLDRTAERGWSQELSFGTIASLQAIAAARRGSAVAVMDLVLMDELGTVWRRAARDMLRRSLLLLVYQPTDATGRLERHLSRLGRLDEEAAVVSDGKKLVGWVALDGPGHPPPQLETTIRPLLERRARAVAATPAEDEAEPIEE